MEHEYLNLSLEEIVLRLEPIEEPDPFYFDDKKTWQENYIDLLRHSDRDIDRQVVDMLNSDFNEKTCNKLMCYICFLRNKIQTTELVKGHLSYKSPFYFNILLVCVIENLVEQNNTDKAKEYAKLYRLDGLSELRQMHLFSVRYRVGFKFDWLLRQCVYLECINKGLETDEDFQTLFNRQCAKPNIPLHNLPKPLTIESIVEVMKS